MFLDMSDTPTPDNSLTGKLLIAMPGMSDPRFERSVVFLCAHSDDGAMGLVVNKPIAELGLSELLEQIKIPARRGISQPVHFGGPVESGRGFVLHSTDFLLSEATLRVDEAFAMTATVEILERMAEGRGPERALVALGYAGWAPGQLEGEIKANGWLVADATTELVFERPDSVKWEEAIRSLGIDPQMLSASAGRA